MITVLKVDRTGAYLNGTKIDNCTRVDIKDINRLHDMTAVIHVAVDGIDVQYESDSAMIKREQEKTAGNKTAST